MRTRGILLTALACLAVVVPPVAVTATVTATVTGDRAGAAGSANPVVDSLADRYVRVRPDVGPTTTVGIGGLSRGGRTLLASLQGLVNRTEARLYVLDRATDPYWIDHYVDEGLVTLAGHTDLTGALDRFASEASGYVLVSEAEPWTLNAGISIASVHGALVATTEHQAALESRGLTLVEDLRGRWPDAPTAYEGLVADYRDQLPYPGVAVLRPTDRAHDFAYQQGMAVLFTRPAQPDWDRMKALITSFPGGHAVYGYLADDGLEEGVSVATLSANGQFLIPSDTTSNLSYHLAVGKDLPRVEARPPDLGEVEPCTTDTVNVVIAISDGDNMVLPFSRYMESAYWRDPDRGQLPLGWSVGPGLAVLGPAMWDHYASTASPNDELVPMIGYGYAWAGAMPDPLDFYETTFALDDALGMTSFWSFSAGTELADSPQWSIIDEAAGDGPPTGVLVGYGGGAAPVYHSPAGRPAFASFSFYPATPTDIERTIRAFLEASPADRPAVAFFSASVWNNTAAELTDRLAPLAEEGVRFLTPNQAAACAPPAPPPPPTTEPPTTSGPSTTTTADPTVVPAAVTPARAPAAIPVAGEPTFTG